MKQSIIGLITKAVFFASSLAVAAETEWPGIKVDVEASKPVTASQSLKHQDDGFHRLAITLSNNGPQPLTIDRITVHIPVTDCLTDDLEILYGGSCMGRTPLLRQKIGSQTAKSSSHMFELLRLANGQYLFAGSLSWRIFLPNFTLKDGALQVWSDGESRQLKPGESIEYEQIVLSRADNWLKLLNNFGSAIASENGISKLKDVDFKGWATWDYYGKDFTSEDIYGNMNALNKLDPKTNLIQIDGGWWTQRGDYQSVRTDLMPGGIKAIVARITAEGKTPGLHFDGFRGDASSEIFKTHPAYFLHDQEGKAISDEGDVYFDYSHPGARAHIAECIRNMKEKDRKSVV